MTTPKVKKTKPALTTPEIEARLAERYSGVEWAFFLQVPSSTGGAARTADAVAMSVWRSRGYYFVGFEIKASRADWLRELQNPKKADPIAKMMHQWYVVVGHEDFIRPGELPQAWGLLVPYQKTLKVAKEAERQEPDGISYAFVASLLRRASRVQSNEARDQALIIRKVEEARTAAQEDARRRIEMARSDYARLHEKVRAFEEASGIQIDRGGLDDIRIKGAMIEALSSGRWDVRRALHEIDSVERVANNLAAVARANAEMLRERFNEFLRLAAPPTTPPPAEPVRPADLFGESADAR